MPRFAFPRLARQVAFADPTALVLRDGSRSFAFVGVATAQERFHRADALGMSVFQYDWNTLSGVRADAFIRVLRSRPYRGRVSVASAGASVVRGGAALLGGNGLEMEMAEREIGGGGNCRVFAGVLGASVGRSVPDASGIERRGLAMARGAQQSLATDVRF